MSEVKCRITAKSDPKDDQELSSPLHTRTTNADAKRDPKQSTATNTLGDFVSLKVTRLTSDL